VNQRGKKLYESPSVKKLTIQQARSYLLQHGREFLDLIFPSKQKQTENGTTQQLASYEPPRLTKLAPEQAKLKLLGHLSLGDQGAKDLLDLLYPEPGGSVTGFERSPDGANVLPLERAG
jgi:hypothetical protein